ncbi:putative RNA-directed DNA polymerase from transposon BS [Trichonephila clavipes]|nr:putative RNA-directed DNA polymerase from transposon BS [Trichonephila clavipes]
MLVFRPASCGVPVNENSVLGIPLAHASLSGRRSKPAPVNRDKRHTCRVSAADKGCWVYPLDPRSDAVVLYSGCTPGKRRACVLPDDRRIGSLVGLCGGWRHARMKFSTRMYGSNAAVPGTDWNRWRTENCPTFKIRGYTNRNSFRFTNEIFSPSEHFSKFSRYNKSSQITEYFSRCAISESELLSTPKSEILEGFSDQGVIQVRRNTIEKDATIIPTTHLILTFNIPKLPPTIKADYPYCKIRPYIPNPLYGFQCERFGHSQTSFRGQLTCSRCACVRHASTDCSLEQKRVNCSQPHSSDSKLCLKWKTEKEIQTIKTNRNISYLEARKLITPQLSQIYAQVTKPSIPISTTQTDENIT